MEGFAEVTQSRIDQDLLMLESGIRTKVLLRRLAIYKELVSSLSAQHEEFAQRYTERVRQAADEAGGGPLHVTAPLRRLPSPTRPTHFCLRCFSACSCLSGR